LAAAANSGAGAKGAVFLLCPLNKINAATNQSLASQKKS
jgi:hypothetical protein